MLKSTAFQADLIGPDQKEYMIVKTQPSEQLCKGKEFMQDRDGRGPYMYIHIYFVTVVSMKKRDNIGYLLSFMKLL